jgi:hypothetical protein
MRDGGYKNIYVMPVTASIFIFLAYFPQVDYAVKLRSCNGLPQLIDKLPLLGTISRNLSYNDQYKLNGDLYFTEGGLGLVVHASVGQFLFPKHKRIEDPEVLKSYGIINGLYAQISKEYDALGKAIEKYNSTIDEREAKLKYLLAKQVIKTGIKIGLYATGVGAGIAAFMDIDDMWTAGETVADVSYIFDISDIGYLGDIADISDVSDLADGLADASMLEDYSDLSDLTGLDTYNGDESNVSFRQKMKAEQIGGGLGKADVDVVKKSGTAHTWIVKHLGKEIAELKSLSETFYVPGVGKCKIS